MTHSNSCSASCLTPPYSAASYLYPSFQGLMSDNDTVRLGLDFQRMLRINRMLYIAARSVNQLLLLPLHYRSDLTFVLFSFSFSFFLCSRHVADLLIWTLRQQGKP